MRRTPLLALLTGLPLLALGHGATAEVGALTVRDVAAQAGIAASTNDEHGTTVVRDLDGDGLDDLVLSNHQIAPAQIFRGAADGTFRLVQELPTADRHGCTAADLDRDGRPDLYCAIGADHGRSTGKSNELWRQRTDGRFALVQNAGGATDPTGRGRAVAAFPADADPFPDLYVGNGYPKQNPSQNRLFRNLAGQGFAEDTSAPFATTTGGLCAVPGDMDGDGWVDLLACSGQLRLWRNEAGTGFRDVREAVGLPGFALSGAWGDLDGDGDLDLVTVSSTRLGTYLWQGTSFRPGAVRTLQAGRDVALADVDRDGDRDVYVVQGRAGMQGPNLPDQLWLNSGNGRDLTALAGLPHTDAGGGSDVAVLPDHRGRPALLVTNGGDGTRTLRGPRQLLVFSGPS